MSWWIWLIAGIGIMLVVILFRRIIIFFDYITTPEITLENIRELIFPKLLLENELSSYQINELPSKPLNNTGLSVLYVIDRPRSVIYLKNNDYQKLGLNLDELNRIALDNLEKRFSREIVEKCIANNQLTVIKTIDSYDAARILLLPKFLPTDVKIIAHVPDKDTLAIVPSTDYGTMMKLMDIPSSGKPLLKTPLLVSSTGYEIPVFD